MMTEATTNSEVSEPWDRSLTNAEIFCLAPEIKAKRARLSLQRKIERLEWATSTKDGLKFISEKDYRSRAALRRWNDESLKLWPWSYRPVDDPDGNNRDLIDRYNDVLALLANLKNGKQVSCDEQLAKKDEIIIKLENQILGLMAQIEKLHQRIALNTSV